MLQLDQSHRTSARHDDVRREETRVSQAAVAGGDGASLSESADIPLGSGSCVLVVGADGTVTFVWLDDLQPLVVEGRAKITRASHVEPTTDGQWTADMAPCGGPILGPFELRSEALKAESRWLAERLDTVELVGA